MRIRNYTGRVGYSSWHKDAIDAQKLIFTYNTSHVCNDSFGTNFYIILKLVLQIDF